MSVATLRQGGRAYSPLREEKANLPRDALILTFGPTNLGFEGHWRS